MAAMRHLRFFRMRSNELTAPLCFEFCISQGLDLFALVENDECRCGATRLNRAVWGGIPRPGLTLPSPLSSCETQDSCPMRVYRWVGPFEGGGSVRARFIKLSAASMAYVDSVVAGRRITPAVLEDGVPFDDGEPTDESLLQGGEGLANPMWERPCNDNPGCQAGRPWIERTTEAPEGMVPQWEEYVIVRYKFDTDVDNTRKEAFRAAAADWRTHTCVAVIEDDNASYPFYLIGIYDTGSCWSNLGRPSSRGRINLGWCKNMNHKGSMIHEIGHCCSASLRCIAVHGPCLQDPKHALQVWGSTTSRKGQTLKRSTMERAPL